MKGGVEHDVIFDIATATVLKFTKPGRAAYAVNFDLGTPEMAPALPLEYPDRLLLQNGIFSDHIRIGESAAMPEEEDITRLDLVKGRPAGWEEIIRLMADDLGFTELRHNHGMAMRTPMLS